MCERAIEQQITKQNLEKSPLEIEPFQIKIEVKSIDLAMLVKSGDPLACVTLAGMVIKYLKAEGKEPTITILGDAV